MLHSLLSHILSPLTVTSSMNNIQLTARAISSLPQLQLSTVAIHPLMPPRDTVMALQLIPTPQRALYNTCQKSRSTKITQLPIQEMIKMLKILLISMKLPQRPLMKQYQYLINQYSNHKQRNQHNQIMRVPLKLLINPSKLIFALFPSTLLRHLFTVQIATRILLYNLLN